MVDIPNNNTTTAIVSVGGTFTDQLEVVGDRDWIRIDLTAGQYVQITLEGSGATPVDDTYLRVYNSSGVLVAENDDINYPTNPNSSLVLAGGETGGTFYIEAASYFDSYAGQYTITTAEVDITILDSLDWGASVADPNITVYFAPAGAVYDGVTSEGFNAYEIQQFNLVFDVIESYTNVTFTVVNDPNADFRLVLDTNELDPGDALAYFYPPGQGSFSGIGVFSGLGWDRTAGGSLERGGDGFATAVHEILHGLGLAHPHDDGGTSTVMNGVSSPFGDYGDYDLNQNVFTMQSYNRGWAQGAPGSSWQDDYGGAGGPMALDIALLQQFYGANMSTASGNNIYTLPDTNATGTYWTTIWDTGGTDEIRYTGTRDVTIDLRAALIDYATGGGGFISTATGIAGGLTIAQNVIIENGRGGSGNDTIVGNNAANTLVGGAGNDTLIGGLGMDTIYGGYGADTIEGGADDDTLIGNNGADTIHGGDGDDTIGGGTENDTLYGDSGNDFIYSQQQDDMVYGGAGNDTLRGGDGNDTLNGEADNDFLYGENGDDILNGGAGNDQLYGQQGVDTLSGGTGTDILRGGDGNDTLNGGDDADILYGENGSDILNGDAGNDQLFGQQQDDTLNGGAGADTLRGGDGNDTLSGGDDADLLYGENGTDVLNGGAGDDQLYGQQGIDTLNGGDDNDYLNGGAGADTLHGNAGSDELHGDVDADFLYGDAGNDTLYGEGQDDYLDGGADDDLLYGGGGNDTLIGGDGIDTLDGSFNNDTLDGGAGDDTLIGGGQADTFVFQDGYDVDTITDFVDDIDEIDLTSFNFVDANDALSNATQVNANVEFDFGNGDMLIVNNITIAQLQNDLLV